MNNNETLHLSLLASGALETRDETLTVLEKIYADSFADLSGIYVSLNYDKSRHSDGNLKHLDLLER